MVHIPLDELTKSSADEIKELCNLKDPEENGRPSELTP
jgi:hypothetical protein